MAAVGRGSETSIMNSNIYDNNAKEIDPAKVRAVIATLIESNFNLVDDYLQSINYAPGITLSQQFESSASGSVLLHSKSGVIDVRGQANGSNVTGDGNATFTVASVEGNVNEELQVQASFSNLGTSNYMPVISWEATGSPWHQNNAVFCSFGSASSTTIRIYLQRMYDNPFGKIWLTLLKLPD